MSEEKVTKRQDPGGLFVPGGVLLGLGFGFLYGNLPAGIFIGLGAGFVLWATISLLRKPER